MSIPLGERPRPVRIVSTCQAHANVFKRLDIKARCSLDAGGRFGEDQIPVMAHDTSVWNGVVTQIVKTEERIDRDRSSRDDT